MKLIKSFIIIIFFALGCPENTCRRWLLYRSRRTDTSLYGVGEKQSRRENQIRDAGYISPIFHGSSDGFRSIYLLRSNWWSRYYRVVFDGVQSGGFSWRGRQERRGMRSANMNCAQDELRLSLTKPKPVKDLSIDTFSTAEMFLFTSTPPDLRP